MFCYTLDDERFRFLNADHVYHGYYLKKKQDYINGTAQDTESEPDEEEEQHSKLATPPPPQPPEPPREPSPDPTPAPCK